jgi:hypothetical protein
MEFNFEEILSKMIALEATSNLLSEKIAKIEESTLSTRNDLADLNQTRSQLAQANSLLVSLNAHLTPPSK